MEKTSQQTALCCVLILASASIGGCFPSNEEIPKTENRKMPWPLEVHPTNGEPVSSQASTNYTDHFTIHGWYRRLDGNNYCGLEATMDVYGFHLEPEQQSSAAIWIYSIGNKGQSSITGFILGWHIHPALYKNSHTHFFTSWTNTFGYPKVSHDAWPVPFVGKGSRPGGCYNNECPGYIRKGGIAPGDVISPVSSVNGKKQYITVRAFKDKSSGDWLVYYGFNGPAHLVGYFPKSLFPDMEEKQLSITFGGFTSHMDTQASPPMGSGFFPVRNAASFNSLKFVDEEGSTHDVDKDLPVYKSPHTCYRITSIDSGRFSYGGPGHCDV